MADGNILSDFGIDLLEEEIDDVIFQTNEFLTDATFTGSQGPFWWILQMCMALAALFAIVMAAGMAYKMMVKHEPLDVMKLFRPLAVSLIQWFSILSEVWSVHRRLLSSRYCPSELLLFRTRHASFPGFRSYLPSGS